MKSAKKLVSAILVVTLCLSFGISFAASTQAQQNTNLEKAFKSELAKIFDIKNPISLDMVVTSTGQKPVGFGVNLLVNKNSFYKVTIDKNNKRYYIESRKDNVASTVFVNGQNIYIKDTKDNKYTQNTLDSNLWFLISTVDAQITPNIEKFNQTLSNYISSQMSSILKSAYTAKTNVGGKNIDCYVLSLTLPAKVTELALKDFILSSEKSLSPILTLGLNTYMGSLSDDDKQLLKSLNIDIDKLSATQIVKQLEDKITTIANSVKLDDMKLSFYIDVKTNKLSKIIVKNILANNAGLSSRIELNNILTGNEVKFPQINQNMIKKSDSQNKLLNILKLIESIIQKMEKMLKSI